MVTTRFIGRLGNSLFQLSAAIGYAKRYGYAWAAPVDARESSIHQVFPNLPKTNVHPGRSFPKREGYDPQWFDYQEIPNVGPDILLAGYFQSLRFFENAQEEVKKAFQLETYHDYSNCVSIHVRRGDYVQYANSFPPIDLSYVDQAIKVIAAQTEERRFLVFSDDLEWCKQEFKKSIWADEATFIFCEETGERKSLSLMASCAHHIIANSSFSWWGAYLGHNPDKIVVCPHRESWYGPDNGVIKWYRENNKPILPDLIPEGWVQIKFR